MSTDRLVPIDVVRQFTALLSGVDVGGRRGHWLGEHRAPWRARSASL